MNKLKFLFVLLILSVGIKAQILEPVKWDISVKHINKTNATIEYKAKIDMGWHLYSTNIPEGGPVATSFSIVKNKNFELIGGITTKKEPHKSFDKNFDMELSFFETEVVFIQKIKILSNTNFKITTNVEFMSCDDKRCLPPTDKELIVEIQNSNSQTTANTPPTKKSSSLITLFFLAFLGGLAAIFTPCVFPMIPMTVSFFIKHAGKSKAIIYGLSIIFIYTLVGTIVAVVFGADFANFLSTHWIPNTLFFIIFAIFAVSFFGYFEITMPSFLVNKASSNEDKSGILGPFFMALTLVLVSFSCTGPIVGAILVASAGGEVLMPIVGMLGFSLAFALPFTTFALFPSLLNSMPKSGGWLNSVKVVLGFIELALGFKFLSIADQAYHWGILDREIYLSIWIVIATCLGLYLFKVIKFPHDDKSKKVSTPRLVLSLSTFAFAIYLSAGLFGQPLKAISGYIPPQNDFNLLNIFDAKKTVDNKDKDGNVIKYSDFLHFQHGIKGYFDIEQATAASIREDKPIFVDFTGHGCVNCREMEASVWSDPKVLDILKNKYIVVTLYVDDKTELPKNDWVVSKYDGKTKKTLGKINADYQITKYNMNAQPYYVLTDSEGTKLTEPRTYDLDIDGYLEFLNRGLENFKKKK